MRDGQGNKLSSEEEAKVKAVEVAPDGHSLNKISVDPNPRETDGKTGEKPASPHTATAPKF